MKVYSQSDLLVGVALLACGPFGVVGAMQEWWRREATLIFLALFVLGVRVLFWAFEKPFELPPVEWPKRRNSTP